MTTERALVLGGGGVAGIAWATGIVAGLADGGVDVREADLLQGTSAGSNVAAQLGSGLELAELVRRQVDPELQSREIVPSMEKFAGLWETLSATLAAMPTDSVERRRKIGALALNAESVPEPRRRAVIESRLPVHEWPERALRITAVDAGTGELRVFDKDSGVALVDAVTASSAVPMVWPCATIGGVRYTDGGVRTSVNADLATGFARVLIIAPMPDAELEAQAAGLVAAGARVEVIVPDEAAIAAFGLNPLDSATRVPSLEAGRAQGKTEAERIAAFWRD
ncbi:patatin-like phospholipase family protein [Nocardia yunnanensis]|uniref:Patatin-like phospholipase family protein n=1 Tax=Nocardia yunnanensis TaxID=2382165 RepID=A0A386Z998_9NOCA|nr:patatin-like phospholipase family protein [Nocardia yunnanensis]AYF73059.1 patatin-like phospholipase family protein [Nocardia yunnanensis]